jgi:hypothetical protein
MTVGANVGTTSAGQMAMEYDPYGIVHADTPYISWSTGNHTPTGSTALFKPIGAESTHTIRWVQGKSAMPTASGTTATTAFTLPVRAGDLLIASVSSAGANLSSVADTLDGTWTSLVSSGNGTLGVFYVLNARAGTTTVTLNLAASSSGVQHMQLDEFSGAGALVTSEWQPDLSGTTFTPPSESSTAANQLVYSAINIDANSDTVTAGSNTGGLTMTLGGSGSGFSDGSHGTEASQWGITAASGSQSSKFTLGTSSTSRGPQAIFQAGTAGTIAGKNGISLTSGVTSQTTANFSPASNVTAPAGEFWCLAIVIDTVASGTVGSGFTLDYDTSVYTTNLNSSQNLVIPELGLPLFGFAAIAPVLMRRFRRTRAGPPTPVD